MSKLSDKGLRVSAAILTLVTAVIHFRYAFFGGRLSLAPLPLSFLVMGVIYVGGAVMILWGKPLFYKLTLVYTIVIIVIYLYAIVGPIPPFTQRPFGPSPIPILDKAVEVVLVGFLGVMSGRTMTRS